MKILFICYEFPTPSGAGSLRTLYSIKYLAEKYGHDIYCLSFKLPGMENADLNNYCHFETIDIAHRPGFESPRSVLSALKQIVHPRNIFSRYPAFFFYSYSAEMTKRLRELVENYKFDVIK